MDTTFPPGTYSPLQLICPTEEALQVTQETYDATLQGYKSMLGVFSQALNIYEAVNQNISFSRSGVPPECTATVLKYTSLMATVMQAPELADKTGLLEEIATCRESIQEVFGKLAELPKPSEAKVNVAQHLKAHDLLVTVSPRVFAIGKAMKEQSAPSGTRAPFAFRMI